MWLLVYAPAILGVLRYRRWSYWRWVVALLLWQAAAQFLFASHGTLDDPTGDGLISRAIRQATDNGPAFAAYGVAFQVLFYGGVVYFVRQLYRDARSGRQQTASRPRKTLEIVALTAITGALLYTSLTDRWSAWTYLWSVLPFSLGLGMYAAGWIADAPAFKWIGSGVALGGVLAYLAFATAFGGEAFRLVAAIGIIGLGLALTVGGLAERLSRKSPAA